MSLSRTGRPGFAPRLEALEDRWCPAASIALSGGTLTVNGSNLADTVNVTIDDARNLVTVTAGDVTGGAIRTFAADTVSRINVFGHGGDDRVTCRLASDMTRARGVSLGLGDGHDSATLDFGLYKAHAISANLSVYVDGWYGSDTVRADFGDVNAAYLTFRALMGEGNDACTANLWGMLRGTQARFDQWGEGGSDSLRFYNDNGSWASTLLNVYLDGGAGNDSVSLFYDDNMVGRHSFYLTGGSGYDLVQAEVHARAGSTGSLDLAIHGGADCDQLRGVLDVTPGATLSSTARMFVGSCDVVLGTTPNIAIVFGD